jgi:hypothetical protein
MRNVDPALFSVSRLLNSVYADASLAIDVRLVGNTDQRYVRMTCRLSVAGQSRPRYELIVYPAAGMLTLERYVGTEGVPLLAWRESPAIRRGTATNRLELGCVGDTISARINGTLVASVRDSAHRVGWWSAGVAAFGDRNPANALFEARLDNLILRQG